jgi:C4-dicarboxylate transporter DctM subunit
MSPFEIGIIGLVVLLVLFAIGVPIAFAMALTGLAGLMVISSSSAALFGLIKEVFGTMGSYPLSVIPMFVLMGSYAFVAGIGRKLYDVAYTTMGQFPGGLTIASVAACTGFGAVCGSTAATCATIGKVAIPEMKKSHYSETLATGTIAAAGGLGILIPPSTALAVYAFMTEQALGKQLAAGIIPGLIIAMLFMVTVYLMCRRNPDAGPPGPKTAFLAKVKSLTGLTDTLVLFGVSMGGLFAGWFSPTQAGAIGAAGALVIGLARRELTWKNFMEASKDGLRISCMIMLLIAGASVFFTFIVKTRIPFLIADSIGGLPVPPWVIMIIICALYFVLGCFVDAMALIVLLVPIFFPLVTGLGFDPIWFGVMITVLSMIAVITPPVGVNAYVIKGLFKDIKLEVIFRGIFPFLIPFVVALALLIAFPQLATFLPKFIRY